MRAALVALLFLIGFGANAEEAVPRTILAIYDSRFEPEPRQSAIHQFAEAPLNYLGLKVVYHDLAKGAPSLEAYPDLRGIMSWFLPGMHLNDPWKLAEFYEAALSQGKKLVIFGDTGFDQDFRKQAGAMALINRIFGALGLVDRDFWVRVTYDWRLEPDRVVNAGFEGDLPAVLPPFQDIGLLDSGIQVHLAARKRGGKAPSILAATNSSGGYAAPGYTHFEDRAEHLRRWYFDPVVFFRRAFATDGLPKPDPTTLAGERVFYAHVDSDGWNLTSELEHYQKEPTIAAEVVRKEIIARFPEVPFTIGIIGAELDPAWYGMNESVETAKKLLQASNVEAAVHGYSHVLRWNAVKHGGMEDTPWKSYYPGGCGGPKGMFARIWGWVSGFWRPAPGEVTPSGEKRKVTAEELPRSYNCEPFSLEQEVKGTAALIQRLEGSKAPVLMQWSGDALPSAEVMDYVGAQGLPNLGGGVTPLGRAHPSMGWIAPFGFGEGGRYQVYARNADEHAASDLWPERYYGFQYLERVLQHTETPYRLTPAWLYFHMHAGQKQAGLNAVLANLDYLESTPHITVSARDYAAMAHGFFTARILQEGSGWRIKDRGMLNTVRMDQAALKQVDFNHSEGVIGQRHYQGNLYIYLDSENPSPKITLGNYEGFDSPPRAVHPYLVKGQWKIYKFKVTNGGFSCMAQGWSKGRMVWSMPQTGAFLWKMTDSQGTEQAGNAETDAKGTLRLDLPHPASFPVTLEVTPAL